MFYLFFDQQTNNIANKMAIRIIITITLVALVLKQTVLASPAASDANTCRDVCHQKSTYAAMAPREKDNSLTPSTQLLKMTLFNLLELTLTYAREAQSTSELLLKDPALKDNNSPEVLEFKKKILEFQQKYASCSDINNLFKLVVFYSTASSDYYEMEDKKTLSVDSKVILDVLKKYGTHEMESEFVKSFNKFVSNFGEKLNELMDNLREEKGKIAGKILNWWEKVKNMQTYDEKMEAFAKFVNLYELD